jgi:hypothetical protein
MTALGEPRAAGAGQKNAGAVTPDWSRAFASRLALTDFIVITWAIVGTQIAWFGTLDAELNMSKYRGGLG